VILLCFCAQNVSTEVDAIFVAWGEEYFKKNIGIPHLEQARSSSSGIPVDVSWKDLSFIMHQRVFQTLLNALGAFAAYVRGSKDWQACGRTAAVVITHVDAETEDSKRTLDLNSRKWFVNSCAYPVFCLLDVQKPLSQAFA
jgi:hypothetical protein